MEQRIDMQQRKINSWFFEKINRIDKFLARLVKKRKREGENY